MELFICSYAKKLVDCMSKLVMEIEHAINWVRILDVLSICAKKNIFFQRNDAHVPIKRTRMYVSRVFSHLVSSANEGSLCQKVDRHTLVASSSVIRELRIDKTVFRIIPGNVWRQVVKNLGQKPAAPERLILPFLVLYYLGN